MRPNRNRRSAPWSTIDNPRERVRLMCQVPFHELRPEEQDEVEDFLSPEMRLVDYSLPSVSPSPSTSTTTRTRTGTRTRTTPSSSSSSSSLQPSSGDKRKQEHTHESPKKRRRTVDAPVHDSSRSLAPPARLSPHLLPLNSPQVRPLSPRQRGQQVDRGQGHEPSDHGGEERTHPDTDDAEKFNTRTTRGQTSASHEASGSHEDHFGDNDDGGSFAESTHHHNSSSDADEHGAVKGLVAADADDDREGKGDDDDDDDNGDVHIAQSEVVLPPFPPNVFERGTVGVAASTPAGENRQQDAAHRDRDRHTLSSTAGHKHDRNNHSNHNNHNVDDEDEDEGDDEHRSLPNTATHASPGPANEFPQNHHIHQQEPRHRQQQQLQVQLARRPHDHVMNRRALQIVNMTGWWATGYFLTSWVLQQLLD